MRFEKLDVSVNSLQGVSLGVLGHRGGRRGGLCSLRGVLLGSLDDGIRSLRADRFLGVRGGFLGDVLLLLLRVTAWLAAIL